MWGFLAVVTSASGGGGDGDGWGVGVSGVWDLGLRPLLRLLLLLTIIIVCVWLAGKVQRCVAVLFMLNVLQVKLMYLKFR